MPELPEAETIARGLRYSVPGKPIEAVTILRPDVVDGGRDGLSGMVGTSIEEVGRRGKNVVFDCGLSGRLVVNLGMTGKLLSSSVPPPAPSSTHPAVLWSLESGSGLTFDDIRRFGRVSWMSVEAYEEWSQTLGPEPLSRAFSQRVLAQGLARSRMPIRSWLLDQRKVAGVGNIYAVEALWSAGIHPSCPANRIPELKVEPLLKNLKAILRRAIKARGTTLRDYRSSDGSLGEFGPTLKAYGREHKPCKRCKHPIERFVLQGRSAFFCPTCQPFPEDPA